MAGRLGRLGLVTEHSALSEGEGPQPGPSLALVRVGPPHPRLAPGTDLLGEFHGHGWTAVQFLVRRSDGTMVVLSETLFRLAELIDGETSAAALADRLSAAVKRRIDADGVQYLIDEKLSPLGITSGTAPVVAPTAALTLAGRTVLFSARAVRPAAGRLRHLFRPPVVVAALAAVLGANLRLFAAAEFSSPVGELVQQPLGILALGAIVLLSAVFHEFGHAAGGAYGGARPGAIGAGIFVVWPAFFSDITDSYRLSRAGRVRTDLGGIYFNLLLTLPLAGLYALTGNPLWKWGVVAQFLIVFQQLLPFLRLDGYYLVSDLTGVPDLFGHLRPALRNVLPGRRAMDPSFAGLRSGVRAAVTVWALGTAAFAGWFGCVMALELPRFAAGAGSLLVSLGSSTVSDFIGRRHLLAGAGLVQLLLVAIQVAGVLVVLQRLVRRWIRSPIVGAQSALYKRIGSA